MLYLKEECFEINRIVDAYTTNIRMKLMNIIDSATWKYSPAIPKADINTAPQEITTRVCLELNPARCNK